MGFFGHQKSADELRAEQHKRLHRAPASCKQIVLLESLIAENPDRALEIGLSRYDGMDLQLNRLQAKVLIAAMLEKD